MKDSLTLILQKFQSDKRNHKIKQLIYFSYTRLRDDPGIRWREEVVSDGVLQTAYSNEIDTILTFDR